MRFETVKEMSEISTVINEFSEIVSTIVVAVEEQSSATREMADNVAQSLTGV